MGLFVGIAVAISLTAALSGTVSASAAEFDDATRGRMISVYRSLRLSEGNVRVAIEQKDLLRIALVNNLLFTIGAQATAQNPPNACLNAVEAFGAAVVAATLRLGPVSTDVGDRVSAAMKASDETVEAWFSDGVSGFAREMSHCEEGLRLPRTARSLPDRLPR